MFFRPHGVRAAVIGGEGESPGCLGFRFDDRSVALLLKKHSHIGDGLSGGVQNSAFDSDRNVRGRVLLESGRAWQTHERGHQYGQSTATSIPRSSGRAPQLVPAIYRLNRPLFSLHKLTRIFHTSTSSVSRDGHEGPILAAHPPPGANLIFGFVVLLT